MAEPILNKRMEKAQSESYLSITSNDIKINLSKEFLKELQKNTYHGWSDEDVIDYIAKAMVDKEKLRYGKNLLRNFSVNFIQIHTMEKMKCWMKETTGDLIRLNFYHE
ncbi:hypothetical protein Tco_0187227 [Tanacetum coccineum]